MGQYATGSITISNVALLGYPPNSPSVAGTSSYTGSTSNFQIEAGASQNSPLVTYDTAVTTGGAQGQISWNAASNDTSRNVSRSLSTIPDSSEWWISLMVNRTSTGWSSTVPAGTNTANRFVVGGFANSLDSNNGIAIGYADVAADGIPDLVLRSNYQTLSTLATNPNANALQFVIVKLNLVLDAVTPTAANDTVSVWVNPGDITTETALGTPVLTVTQNVANSLKPFNSSRLISLGVTGVAKFDELRLATTLSGLTGLAAIPEANSFLVGATVSLVFAAGYRLRRR